MWARPDSLDFFSTQRNRPEHLYPSEQRFLPDVLGQVTTCLDVGCAAGGFAGIMRTFNPDLRYTGLDVNPEFIAIARARYPECEFVVGDGVNFATPPEAFDLVFSTGLLHLNTRYADMVRACYAQARRFLLCDFRLTYGESITGTHRVAFGTGDAAGVLPYYVLNVDEVVTMLCALSPAPRSVRAYGYFHAPTANASLPLSEVLTTFFLVEKGDGQAATVVHLELPGPTS